MFNENGSSLKAHVAKNIPERLWYSTTRNGVTRLAHARLVELEINEIRRNLKPGLPKPHFEIFVTGPSPTLNFSDCSELMRHDSQGRALRLQEGICGNMADLDYFFEVFPVTQGLPIWIPSAEMFRKAQGSNLGFIGNKSDFRNVLGLAQKIITVSHSKLKD